MVRNYRKETQDYYGYGKYNTVTPLQKRHRREKSGRNKARKLFGKCKGDVHHKNGNAQDNKRSNLSCVSVKYNRSRNTKKTKV